MADLLTAARGAHAERDWLTAFERFALARDHGPLSPEDLYAWSDAAWWLGRTGAFLKAAEGAFAGFLEEDRPREAAMTAIELAVSLFLRGEDTSGSGWLGRAQRLLAELPEGPEHGFLRYVLEVEGGLEGHDLSVVVAAARDVQGIGRRHGEPNLVAAGVLGEGRALVRMGEVRRGLQLLDEAMLCVRREDLDPEWAGNIYCHLMAACHELSDIGRAREWTAATWDWLSDLPAAVLFTGICRVHRSQVHQVSGEWARSEREAERVLDDLDDLHIASVAEAHYQLGDLHRMRGNVDRAERDYGRARELGRDPQPGLALLHLALGRGATAAAALRAALHSVGQDRLARARLCTAQVEVALAVGDLVTARRACTELEDAAATYGTSGLEAAALHWRGALALAEDRPAEALPALRAACRRWHDVQAPYEAARSCVLLGRSYHSLGDDETAGAELRAARDTFERLGASIDLDEVAELLGDRTLPGGLTAREAQVLRLVASGKTNREVAEELVLSEKTIARHLSNIFSKLDVSTRTEAAAFAFEQGLAGSGRG